MTLARETPHKLVVSPKITWEPLPPGFQLDEEPVDNIDQTLLAGALSESLELAGYLKPTMLVGADLGICATIDEQLNIKAPDWFYASPVQEWTATACRKSYTPHLEGAVPSIVIEFLSDKDGSEYSVKRSYPPGKWYYYEQILKIPTYAIFEPDGGLLEVYRLPENGRYELEQPNEEGKHWIAEMGLFLGTWRGEKEGRTVYWLRWWDEAGNLLLWGVELLQQERQRADAESLRAEEERQRADAESLRAEEERQRAEKLAAYLRQQGINPDDL
ncbi:Uma2 family endonuclease [Oscillatoria sp. FACHB-1406]|uniref:Uma2 family endonuclease n=1 Tax=Oscillatoria sp. FACHB-1406 TaxID=2692846 RepID=UPI0016898F91|nr:Uma2 family endonuclease [Oscillatoria sp. FACHB-1406]MBD2577711.1 Uma2 family endonuclease [Oscillatoria sp. FACHB-1406]